MRPTRNGNTALQCFEHGNTIKMCNGIMFLPGTATKSATTHHAIDPPTGLGSWQYQETFVAKEKDKWMAPSRDCNNRQNTFHECSSELDLQ